MRHRNGFCRLADSLPKGTAYKFINPGMWGVLLAAVELVVDAVAMAVLLGTHLLWFSTVDFKAILQRKDDAENELLL